MPPKHRNVASITLWAALALTLSGCSSFPLIHPFLQSAQPFSPGEQGLGVNVVMVQAENGIDPFTTLNYRMGVTDRMDLSFLAYSMGGRMAAKFFARDENPGPAVSFEVGSGPFLSESTKRGKLGYSVDGTIVLSKDYGPAKYYGGYRQAVFLGPALDGGAVAHGIAAFGYEQKVYQHLSLLGEIALVFDMDPASQGAVYPFYSFSFLMPWGGPRSGRRKPLSSKPQGSPIEVVAVEAHPESDYVTVEIRIQDDQSEYLVDKVTISPVGGRGVPKRAALVCPGPGRYAVVLRTPDPVTPGTYAVNVDFVKGRLRIVDPRHLPIWDEPPERGSISFPFEVK